MFHRLAIVAMVFLPLLGCALDPTDRPALAEAEGSVENAVFADGRLWVLSDIGILSSISESSSGRVWESFADYVTELWVDDGRPSVITCKSEECSDWIIRRRTGDGWTIEATVHRENERLLAVTGAANTVLLTSRRIITIDGDKTNAISLSKPFDFGTVTGLSVTPQRMFVGLYQGEFGGGLRRIDRNTGEVTTIERNISGGLCGGPLNSDCDPVNGVAVAPWDPECLVLSIGLIHLGSSHGRINEVCGTAVQRLYFQPLGNPQQVPGSDEPFETVSFFQLVRGGNLLWVFGIGGIYRIDQRDQVRLVPVPKFRNIGGVYASFDLPGIIVVKRPIARASRTEEYPPLLVSE